MSDAWKLGWRTRLYSQLKKAGYADLTALADAHPAATFDALARMVEPAAPIQIQSLLREEAQRRHAIGAFARSALVRCIREEMPRGWSMSKQEEYHRASAFAEWSSLMGLENRDHCKAAWEKLKAQDIPEGWLPNCADDPFIVSASVDVAFSDKPWEQLDVDSGGQGKPN